MYAELKKQRTHRRHSPLRAALLGALLLSLVEPALAVDSCETNFKADGNPQDGLRFSTWKIIPNIDIHSTLEQMQYIAQKNGFQVDPVSYQSTDGTLTIHQKATAFARGFPLLISAKKSENSVAISTQLPTGMQAKPQDVRNSMCGMLGGIGTDGKGEYVASHTPATAAGNETQASSQPTSSYLPPTKLASTSTASINETCDANFFGTLDTTIGRSFTTWVPVANPDPRDTIAQFKQAATLGGFEVGAEDYHGTEGTLTVSLKSTDKSKGFPFHIYVDKALGAISIATRVNPNQETPIDGTRHLMCSMIALATGAPLPATSSPSSGASIGGIHFRNPFKKQQSVIEQGAQKQNERTKIYRDAMDALFQRALAAGKSIVIIPSINLDNKYAPGELKDKHPEFWADETSTTIWQGVTDPKNVFKVGFDASIDKTGLHGYVYEFTAGKSYYLAYIVNPDTYTVTGNTHEVERASMPQASSTKKSTKPELGQVSLAEAKNTEFYETQEWFNAVYRDRTIQSDYCTLEMVGGPCVQWNSSTQTVRDQVDAGGWKTVTKSRLADGLVVATKLTKEFASFKVAPGEAILVDGFFAEYPNTSFDNEACQQVTESKLQCDITQYGLIRVPGRIDDLKNQNVAAEETGLPNLAKILSAVKYRPMKVTAVPGSFVSGWGQNYLLKDH